MHYELPLLLLFSIELALFFTVAADLYSSSNSSPLGFFKQISYTMDAFPATLSTVSKHLSLFGSQI